MGYTAPALILLLHSLALDKAAADSSPANPGLANSSLSHAIHVDMFRAVPRSNVTHLLQNIDLASLSSVIGFIHTEVVGEHFPQPVAFKRDPRLWLGGEAAEEHGEVDAGIKALATQGEQLYGGDKSSDLSADHGSPLNGPRAASGATFELQRPTRRSPLHRRNARTGRHHGIEVIMRVPFQVKNSDSLLTSKMARLVDFGPDVNFAQGEAQGKEYKWDHGDFVGAGIQNDSRYPVAMPVFWFSVSGVCPNLKWSEKFIQSKDGSTTLNRHCMVGPTGSGMLRGGLCPGGTQPGALPTGELGCIYTYQPPTNADIVAIDDLAGITKEDCGRRKCVDWADFRENCTAEKYKMTFNYGKGKLLVKTKYCVEYAVHPSCRSSCHNQGCRALQESQKDIGLPFWRGRCSWMRNGWRAEKLAAAFGIPAATTAHQLDMPRGPDVIQTCLRGNHSICNPEANIYCTRHWAGICTPCHIPGMEVGDTSASRFLPCPWDVLSSKDYSTSEPPVCRTGSPRDLCCLYSGTCNVTVPASGTTAGNSLPLDEDGYAAVASRQSTEGMKAFFIRYHQEKLGGTLVDDEGLGTFSYWQWAANPIIGNSLRSAVRGSWRFFQHDTVTSTMTSTTSTMTSTVTPGTTGIAPVQKHSAMSAAQVSHAGQLAVPALLTVIPAMALLLGPTGVIGAA